MRVVLMLSSTAAVEAFAGSHEVEARFHTDTSEILQLTLSCLMMSTREGALVTIPVSSGEVAWNRAAMNKAATQSSMRTSSGLFMSSTSGAVARTAHVR